MIEPIWKALRAEFSAQGAWDQTAEVHRRDRLSTAAAFARTADYVEGRMRDLGLVDLERIPFKADGRTLLGDWLPSPAWDAEEAELTILEPADLAGRLCRYPDNPICLAMNSGATPPAGIIAELVDAAAVKDPRAFRGKFVLPPVAERPRNVRAKYAELGAAGLVSDWKPGGDHPDRRLTEPEGTYWENVWHEPWDRPRLVVFKIPPKTAERLRAALRAGKRIRLHATARTRNYAGRIDTVTGVIPGRDRVEEILVVGHLYEIGANDNASGAGCMLELARTIQALRRRRRIPALRRSIRFIFPWECYGSLAYVLSRTARRHRALAGINPDMVGNDQCRSGSVMQVSRSPDFCPAPTNALLDRLFGRLADEDETYRWAWSGSAGDDGLFFCDPAIGAGTSTLTMWPDRFYHSDQDTMDKVSPQALRQAGTVMGTFTAFLAAAGRGEARWLANEVLRWSRARFDEFVAETVDFAAASSVSAPRRERGGEGAAPAERLAWLRDRSLEHLRSVARFVPDRQRPALVRQLAPFETLIKVDAVSAGERIAALAGKGALGQERPALPRFRGLDAVPRRLIGGHPSFDRLTEAQRGAINEAAAGLRVSTLYYLCDGRRTVADIHQWLRGEFGSCDPAKLMRTFRLLERFGYVRLGE